MEYIKHMTIKPMSPEEALKRIAAYGGNQREVLASVLLWARNGADEEFRQTMQTASYHALRDMRMEDFAANHYHYTLTRLAEDIIKE